MDQVEYSCTKCGRKARSPRAKVLQLVASKRGCQVCGGPLAFPPDVRGAPSPAGERVSNTCGCDRTHTKPLAEAVAMIAKGKTLCPVCNEDYEFPREVREAAMRPSTAVPMAPSPRGRDADCPTCLRSVRADVRDPGAVLKCTFCGARVRAALEGRGFRPPPLEGPAAPVSEVRRLSTFPNDELGSVSREALLARAARGEVSLDEAKDAAGWQASLAAWQPDGVRAFLPLPPEVAAHALPATVFAGLGREPSSARELVFVTGHETGVTTKGVLNIIGVAAALTTGTGFLVYGGSEGNTRRKVVRLRVSLIAASGGVELELARQVEDRPLEPTSAKEYEALRERIASVVPAIRHYLVLLAIFGPWARGTPIATATAPAIERRLVSLGEPLASRAGPLARRLRSGLDTVSS